MYRVEFMLCAHGAALDRDSGSVSIFEIFDGIVSQALPINLHRVVVVALLRRDADDPEVIECQLVVSRLDVELFRSPVAIDFQGAVRNKAIIQLYGLRIDAPGEINFLLTLPGGGEGGRFMFIVHQPEPPAVAPAE